MQDFGWLGIENLTMIWNNNIVNDVSEIQPLVTLSPSVEFTCLQAPQRTEKCSQAVVWLCEGLKKRVKLQVHSEKFNSEHFYESVSTHPMDLRILTRTRYTHASPRILFPHPTQCEYRATFTGIISGLTPKAKLHLHPVFPYPCQFKL